MTHDPTQQERRKRRDKPFPWLCPNCLKDEVYPVTMPYAVDAKHDGRSYHIEVPELRIPKCKACGELIFSMSVDDQIVQALRSHVRILTPEQIKAGRKALGLRSKELAERLGVAAATLSRWEKRMMIQSRAMDNLLRVYFAVPEARAVLQGPNQDDMLGTPPVLCRTTDKPGDVPKLRRNGISPTCHGYAPDKLVQALQKDGDRLLEEFFQPMPDLKIMIRCAVEGNTFRSFQKLARPPSEMFREWATSRLSSVLEQLREIQDQAHYDQFLADQATHLGQHWLKESEKELPYGPGRKLLDLLFKSVIRWTQIPDASRKRLIQLLHVPLDKYSLAAVRESAASGEFGLSITIPLNATMGFVTSEQLYCRLQQLLQSIADKAQVPRICIDLLAWDDAHAP